VTKNQFAPQEPKNTEKESTATEQYAFWVKLAAVSASSVALILVVIKFYAWLMTDSSAMLASTTDSLLDLFASVMSVVILRFALAPADEEHKFGHGKAESLAGLVQAAFVLGSAILLIFSGVERVINPQVIVRSEVAIWVTCIALVLTVGLVVLQKMVIKKTGSVVISGDALHYKSDILLNIGVLLAVFLSQGLWSQADGVFTILVAIFLLVSAGQIIYTSIYQLMDSELSDEELAKIEELIGLHNDTLGFHELRTRQAGPKRFIQFHLELNDDLCLLGAHQICDEVEDKICEEFAPCEVFIHPDPISIVKRKNHKNS
jgi:ferrous-iron efflux pump FieF